MKFSQYYLEVFQCFLLISPEYTFFCNPPNPAHKRISDNAIAGQLPDFMVSTGLEKVKNLKSRSGNLLIITKFTNIFQKFGKKKE